MVTFERRNGSQKVAEIMVMTQPPDTKGSDGIVSNKLPDQEFVMSSAVDWGMCTQNWCVWL